MNLLAASKEGERKRMNELGKGEWLWIQLVNKGIAESKVKRQW